MVSYGNDFLGQAVPCRHWVGWLAGWGRGGWLCQDLVDVERRASSVVDVGVGVLYQDLPLSHSTTVQRPEPDGTLEVEEHASGEERDTKEED